MMERPTIRVFPRRTHWTPTDEYCYFSEPPLFRPGTSETPVHVSVTFTWDKPIAERLYRAWSQFYSDVQIGGPAYDSYAGDFQPGMYLKEGCTITSRGCPKRCGWCDVPRREGALRLLPIVPGWIVQDNNLLACPRDHTSRVFEMLREQDRRIYFNGGLDKHYLAIWHLDLFDSISIGELWFACDQLIDLPALERAAELLSHIPRRKKRCYTMIGYDGETLRDAEYRLTRVLELGFLPFSQLFQDTKLRTYSPEWRALNRKWSRPAAYLSSPDVVERETLFSGAGR